MCQPLTAAKTDTEYNKLNRMKTLNFVLLILISAIILSCEKNEAEVTPSITWTKYTTADGLSNNIILV